MSTVYAITAINREEEQSWTKEGVVHGAEVRDEGLRASRERAGTEFNDGYVDVLYLISSYVGK